MRIESQAHFFLGLVLVFVSGAGCLSPLPDPVRSPPTSDVESRALPERSPGTSRVALDWGPFSTVDGLEFSFFDAETADVVHVTGPYRLVYWDEDRIDLVAGLGLQLGAFPEEARVTLLEQRGEFWVQIRVVGREYLTRIR